MPERGRGRPTRSEVFTRLESALDDMYARFGGLPKGLEAQTIWRDIWREEAHNSTALEGNTLVQREVDELLERGVTVAKRKDLSEYLDVKGYADAAHWVYVTGIDPAGDWTTGDLLSPTELRYVHSMTVSLAWSVSPPPLAKDTEGPGTFRESDIQTFSSGMTPPSWPMVMAEITDWLRTVNDLRNDCERYPIRATAETHAAFERIHPFIDGNGRTGRLLLNLVLVRLGMPPAIIYNRDRDRYLAALARADAGDSGALTEIIARAVLNNLNRLMLPKLAGPARLVPLASLAGSNISHSALRNAATRGALRATRDNLGQWQSTQDCVEEYLAQRNVRRGRPRASARARTHS